MIHLYRPHYLFTPFYTIINLSENFATETFYLIGKGDLMRIDFHAHTQKCKEGDGSKRNISPENFVKKMEQHNVVMCAITNHNKFDIEEFDNILSLEHNFIPFPGIELDIQFSDTKHYHTILVCDPTEAKKFYSIFDNDNSRNYDSFILSYDSFISKVKEFDHEKIIIIPHFLDKDKRRAFSPNDKAKLQSDLEGYVVILEPGKIQTMGIINSHDELALLGSDVKDWNLYSSNNLPEIKFQIDSFGKFYELANNPKLFIKTVLDGAKKYSIPLSDVSSSTIDIFEDINIIFGEKGSGKTVLLEKYLLPFFRDSGKNVFLHLGKDYEKEFNNLISSYENEVIIDKDLLDEIAQDFKKLIEYSESNRSDFIDQYVDFYRGQVGSKKARLLAKTDAIYSEADGLSFEELNSGTTKDIKKIDNVVEVNNRVQFTNKSERDSLNLYLDLLRKKVLDNLKEEYKSNFINNMSTNFLDILKSSVTKKTGKKTKPNKLGFSDLVSKRSQFLANRHKLITLFKEIERIERHKLGILPNKGKIILETRVVCMKENDYHSKGSPFEKNKIKLNRGIIEKITQHKQLNFKDINSYFSSEEKEVRASEFASEIIKKVSRIKLNSSEDYEPSEGEKAILSISGLLENSTFDCYLFDEIERGLGNKYVSEYLIPQLTKLRDLNKTVILSTHNANIAINTLPSQVIYSDYFSKKNSNYFMGNMYSGELFGDMNILDLESWEEQALLHLEGSQEMFNRRKNVYGI